MLRSMGMEMAWGSFGRASPSRRLGSVRCASQRDAAGENGEIYPEGLHLRTSATQCCHWAANTEATSLSSDWLETSVANRPPK